MSYCRWSSDNHRCDVYCYEHVQGGFAIHVASKRWPEGAPPDPAEVLWPGYVGNDTYAERRKAWDEWAEANPPRPIDHPLAGQTFMEPSAAEAADRLEALRAEGFVVPGYAIGALRDEAAEADGV